MSQPIRILLNGAKGRMGLAIANVAASELAVIAAGVDQGDDIAAHIGSADVVIDFSFHSATLAVAQLCAKHKKPLVIGTTGHTTEEKAAITAAKDGAPLELLIQRGTRFQTVAIDYRGGLRWPWLERAAAGKNYGVILVPEGLIEFVPEMNVLLKEINELLAHGTAFAFFSAKREQQRLEVRLGALVTNLDAGAIPVVEDGQIRGIITESKAGREAIFAKRVIDATGDADIAERAGALTHKTPKSEMMSVSVMFSMCGVNKTRFIEQVKADPQTYKDWAGNGEWDITTDGKEDDMFSPFLRKPFAADPLGTLSRIRETGYDAVEFAVRSERGEIGQGLVQLPVEITFD